MRSISTGVCRPCSSTLVADRHLRLAVRAQVADLAGAAHAREPLADAVREDDRHRHQLGRLARRVAEHHPLVAGADAVDRVVVARVVLHLVRRVDTLRDVGRLRVDRHDDAARVRVEAELGVRVADPADRLVCRLATSTYVSVVISPATMTSPVVTSVSQATRPLRSSRSTASRTASETWSATLSGWPSVTDSDVKRNSRSDIRGRLPSSLTRPSAFAP